MTTAGARISEASIVSSQGSLFRSQSVAPLSARNLVRNRKVNGASSCRPVILRGHQNPIAMPVRCVMEKVDVVEVEKAQLPVGTCTMRTLSPALTLERGLEKIEQTLRELKLNPPHSPDGIYRIQIEVPPSSKALKWFSSQPVESHVFPQFYLSGEKDGASFKSLDLNGPRGVFGLGAAIAFNGYTSSTLADWNSFSRNISIDSVPLKIYGLTDIDVDMNSTSIKHETGSSYLFIPQIELYELEGSSMLAATIVWGDCSARNFDEALQSCELSLYQVNQYLWPTVDRCYNKSLSFAVAKFDVLEDPQSQMVCAHANSLSASTHLTDNIMKDVSYFPQFLVRLSRTQGISNNMCVPAHVPSVGQRLSDSANINTLWASLIVEECCRLGLTYFCIAPGSRSSPLACAASTHPLATAISCFDERSLAFHAVGYARGSGKPAIVITSSGTAVSNLLPAVVEASQDYLPLLLLTADRPPELRQSGANQAITQVNHFGSYVRVFYGLPAPTDEINARMALTTIDSAVHLATTSPCGPVHVNCPFRDPLDNSQRKWMLKTLNGLDTWISRSDPFTSYVQMQNPFSSNNTSSQTAEVLKLIQEAKQGLLVISALHTEDDIWAALLLAKHLSWPVVTDILSGLKLRKYSPDFTDMEDNIYFVDHVDNFLLSKSVRAWALPDVILQVGSRITSKRIYQLMDDSVPCSYILVDKQPSRHDPSHILTHRIQSTIPQFVDSVIKTCSPQVNNKWFRILQALDKRVEWEISSLFDSESALTEPYVAYTVSKEIHHGSAIFIGNSMSIRDMDMYGCKQSQWTNDSQRSLTSELPCQSIQVVGNRGASGIDGLLSTAVGFARGCSKRVICVLGDISFLHDTNGLALLKQRISRKPMTVIIINNGGGAIFSLLPVADKTDRKILNEFFYTTHDVSIENLCKAHCLNHVSARTKQEFQDALLASQHGESDCVIEVQSNIDDNVTFHSKLKNFTIQGVDQAFDIISKFTDCASGDSFSLAQVSKMEYSLYKIQLSAPPTYAYNDASLSYRDGFIIKLSFEDGSTGLGEVAPLGSDEENFAEVEEQLRFLVHATDGAKISCDLPQLKGSFSNWIWKTLGILPESLFPSVRCGLEMAILNAITAKKDLTLLNVLRPETASEAEAPSAVQICGLLDSIDSPTDAAHAAAALVEQGFSAIKIKVARQADPIKDSEVIQAVRKKVGHDVILRVDANKRWTYEQAVQFASSVKECDLQYIEEPLQNEDEIIKYCEETRLPVALDETIDKIQDNHVEMLTKFSHPGIAAIVIKPSTVGGFENAAIIARWAQQHGKMAVVSSAFESSLGLSAYVQFSKYIELQNNDVCKAIKKEPLLEVAHGLGTYQWLKEDVSIKGLNIGRSSNAGHVEASCSDASSLLRKFEVNDKAILDNYSGEQVRNNRISVDSEGFSFSINTLETGPHNGENTIVFLHGFLGTGEDWVPIMKAISGSARCIAIDFPGHGASKLERKVTRERLKEPNLSIEGIADTINKVISQIAPGKVTIVGYSMGARIALYMASRFADKIKGAVIVSGSPGLKDSLTRKNRRTIDDSRSQSLVAHGLEQFLDGWYSASLWNSLREHPHFKRVVSTRLQHDNVQTLAKVLSDSSVGRQRPLWDDLKNFKVPLQIIVGEKDEKYKQIAEEMLYELNLGVSSQNGHGKHTSEIVEIPNSGHAVHIENPLAIISALRGFMRKWTRY